MGDNDTKVRFKYVASKNLQDCYVNGVGGGITPRGEINLFLYNERRPIPDMVVYDISDDSSDNPKTKTSCDAIRKIACSIVMNSNTAEYLRDWLEEVLEEINEMEKVESEDE
jgi:hypothetical protein